MRRKGKGGKAMVSVARPITRAGMENHPIDGTRERPVIDHKVDSGHISVVLSLSFQV